MTKQETFAIIESVWTKHLQNVDSVPEDLANKFSMWLQAVLKKAAPLLSSKAQVLQQPQEQPQQPTDEEM